MKLVAKLNKTEIAVAVAEYLQKSYPSVSADDIEFTVLDEAIFAEASVEVGAATVAIDTETAPKATRSRRATKKVEEPDEPEEDDSEEEEEEEVSPRSRRQARRKAVEVEEEEEEEEEEEPAPRKRLFAKRK